MLLLIFISAWVLILKKLTRLFVVQLRLPHGTGKTKKVLVLCTPDKEAEAKAAGADFVGLDELCNKDRRRLG